MENNIINFEQEVKKEWQMNDSEQDFFTVSKHLSNDILVINKNTFETFGTVEFGTNNFQYKYIENKKDDEHFYALIKFKPKETQNYIHIAFDDFLVIGDFLYNFKAIFEEKELRTIIKSFGGWVEKDYNYNLKIEFEKTIINDGLQKLRDILEQDTFKGKKIYCDIEKLPSELHMTDKMYEGTLSIQDKVIETDDLICTTRHTNIKDIVEELGYLIVKLRNHPDYSEHIPF